MINWKKITLILVMVSMCAMLVQASNVSPFLNNGFQALFYHSMRLDETYPSLNPLGIAIEEFEKAARDGHQNAEANLMMGMIYQYLNRPGTALGYYLEFAKAKPEEIWVNSFIGDLYFEMGRTSDAQNYYEKVISQGNPEEIYSQVYLGLGNIAFDKGEYLQAKDAFEMALNNSADSLDARVALGKSLYYLDDYEEAVSTLELAQLQAPRSVPVFYYLGLSYEALGRHEQAQYAFQRVDELQNVQ